MNNVAAKIFCIFKSTSGRRRRQFWSLMKNIGYNFITSTYHFNYLLPLPQTQNVSLQGVFIHFRLHFVIVTKDKFEEKYLHSCFRGKTTRIYRMFHDEL